MEYLKALFIATLAVFAPIQASLVTVVVLIFADLITGIWAAYKRDEQITSSGLRRTISKLILFEAGLALGFLAETYLLYGTLPLAKLIAGMIAMTELKSISENTDDILGESLFTVLMHKLGSDNEAKKSKE